MRTIKFRGFNRKNNEWLYGSYILNRGKHFVAPDEFAIGKSWEDYQVDPDSVGQMTGLKDIKGNLIYENDILQCGDGCSYICEYHNGHFVLRDLKEGTCYNNAMSCVSAIIGNKYKWKGEQK